MAKVIKIAAVLGVWLWLTSCNESPYVEFHSYQELNEYEFFSNGWFPEILREDAFGIQETYDVTNKHLFGKFDFKRRTACDSILANYRIVEKDSLVDRIEKINKPRYPQWFIRKEEFGNDRCIFVKHKDFFLIVEKEANRIYFVR